MATNRARIASPRSVRMIQRDDVVVPLELGDRGGEQRVVVEAERALAMRWQCSKISGAYDVLLRRHVAGLFEQRQVDHRRGVAHRARVAVPVPRAAEVAAALDDAHVVDARPASAARR